MWRGSESVSFQRHSLWERENIPHSCGSLPAQVIRGATKIIQNGLPHKGCNFIYIYICVYTLYIYCIYIYILYVYIYIYTCNAYVHLCTNTYSISFLPQFVQPEPLGATEPSSITPRFWAAFILAESRVESGKTGTAASCTCQKSRLL